MAEIQVRAATPDDMARIVALDYGYSTDYVWQLDVRGDSGAEQIQVTFRTVRLPRPMRVSVPAEPERLASNWERRACRLVAEQDGHLKGFLTVALAPADDTAWIADCVVERRFRRSGVGSVLLRSAAHWSRTNNLKRLIVEMQSKNYPAICFAQKHGLAFCGYNDRYYANQDVALFFGMVLK
jgi:GNAT superfamily N-acetyltransferase